MPHIHPLNSSLSKHGGVEGDSVASSLEHLGKNNLKQMACEDIVLGFNYDISKSVRFCESCVNGKIHRCRFPTTGRRRGEEPLSIVHSDVCGIVNTKSLGGNEYFLTFVDDEFLKWKAMVEKRSRYKLKVLRTDNGGEFTSTEFQEYLQQEGIRHDLTVLKTPQQNRVAEQMNRTYVETTHLMLFGAKLPQRLWAEALSTAVYHSRTKVVKNITLCEAWLG